MLFLLMSSLLIHLILCLLQNVQSLLQTCFCLTNPLEGAIYMTNQLS